MSACLLVDMGNSRIKWAWLREGGLLVEQAAYDESGLPALLDRHWARLDRPRTVWLACVSGQARQLIDWVAKHWQLDVRVAVSSPVFGELRNGYYEPERLGVDRWLALIGARAAYPGQALCVLDLGTAVTLDIVDASGQHLGGYIIPGLSLMRDSLKMRTGLLSGEGHSDELGRDTASAIGLGLRQALLGLLRQALAVYGARYSDTPRVLLTGGDAAVLAEAMSLSHEQRPALVLVGLAELAIEGNENPCGGSSPF